jgi:hypothetical protein
LAYRLENEGCTGARTGGQEIVGAALRSDLPEAVAADVLALIARARQAYLGRAADRRARSYPRSGRPYVECANEHFRYFADHDERIGSRLLSAIKLLTAGEIGERLAQFVAGDEAAHQFEATDGRQIAGRHFIVRLGAAAGVKVGPPRLLISLIDRTSQVETERSLRGGMLLDSLTGLPTGSRSTSGSMACCRIQAAGGRYAVLALDMTRFSRVNECMGAMAGDELLITFARRLVRRCARPTCSLARQATSSRS